MKKGLQIIILQLQLMLQEKQTVFEKKDVC
jgi:hypothetical protein